MFSCGAMPFSYCALRGLESEYHIWPTVDVPPLASGVPGFAMFTVKVGMKFLLINYFGLCARPIEKSTSIFS